MKLEDYLREYRRANNLSMQEFANRCGLSKAYISMLEKGQHPQSKRPLVPSMETFKKLCFGMRISTQDLFAVLDVQDWIDNGFDIASETTNPLTPDESQLIQDYRDASEEIREEAGAMLHRSAERNRRSNSETGRTVG